MLMDGLHVPVTTPFYRDGKSYLRKLEHNVGRYSLTPAAGLLALTGEGVTLSDDERRETLQAFAAFAAPEKVLVAAIAQPSVYGALAVAEEAERAGFDAVLLRPGIQAMVYLRAVADASPLPAMLWSAGLDVDAIAELALHPNIVGAYDAGLTVERYRAIVAATAGVQREVAVTTVFAPLTRRMMVPVSEGAATFVTAESLGRGGGVAVAPPKAAIKTRTKKVGFQVMAAGRVAGVVELLEAGAAGVMAELAACAPQALHEVYAALKDGDVALAHLKEQRVLEADALLAQLGVAGVKYACDLNGYYGGVPRLPLLPLTAEDRSRVERAFSGLRN